MSCHITWSPDGHDKRFGQYYVHSVWIIIELFYDSEFQISELIFNNLISSITNSSRASEAQIVSWPSKWNISCSVFSCECLSWLSSRWWKVCRHRIVVSNFVAHHSLPEFLESLQVQWIPIGRLGSWRHTSSIVHHTHWRREGKRSCRRLDFWRQSFLVPFALTFFVIRAQPKNAFIAFVVNALARLYAVETRSVLAFILVKHLIILIR